jgi:serine/threonine protein kinase
MLCGYLPFDDDPCNPDGQDIQRLYRYITSTALTFPNYVSKESQKVLKGILTPDPKKRWSLEKIRSHSYVAYYLQQMGYSVENKQTRERISPRRQNSPDTNVTSEPYTSGSMNQEPAPSLVRSKTVNNTSETRTPSKFLEREVLASSAPEVDKTANAMISEVVFPNVPPLQSSMQSCTLQNMEYIEDKPECKRSEDRDESSTDTSLDRYSFFCVTFSQSELL